MRDLWLLSCRLISIHQCIVIFNKLLKLEVVTFVQSSVVEWLTIKVLARDQRIKSNIKVEIGSLNAGHQEIGLLRANIANRLFQLENFRTLIKHTYTIIISASDNRPSAITNVVDKFTRLFCHLGLSHSLISLFTIYSAFILGDELAI